VTNSSFSCVIPPLLEILLLLNPLFLPQLMCKSSATRISPLFTQGTGVFMGASSREGCLLSIQGVFMKNAFLLLPFYLRRRRKSYFKVCACIFGNNRNNLSALKKVGSGILFAQKAVIHYLKQLGITAVELLPTHQFIVDKHLSDKGLTDYWGYNSIGFFAPDGRYAAHPLTDGEPVTQFKEMVRTLHAAGSEIILDEARARAANWGLRGVFAA
jgi:hypothetical protein